MVSDRELKESMRPPRSGTRIVGRVRILLAHDMSSACDSLASSIESAMGDVEIIDVSSVDAGRATLHSMKLSVCFICLDLPPAPQGAVRLATEAIRVGAPFVLVTRSLRWLPASATTLHDVPWVPPDATPAAVTTAVLAATGATILRTVGRVSEPPGVVVPLRVAGRSR